MLATSRYRRHHVELMELFAQFTNLSEEQAAKNSAPLSQALLRLYGLLVVHLALEDRSLYPRMRDCSDPALRRLAVQYQNEMGNLKELFEGFYHRWLQASAIQAHPSEFKNEAHSVVGSLQQRIEREDREFYPRIDAEEAKSEGGRKVG